MTEDTKSYFEPKMSISVAADFLELSVQGVHTQLRAKNLVCPKLGNKSYITNSIAKKLFGLKFDRKVIVSQIVKGGTGKTTSIQNISCCASAYGAKILQIDIDPQGNLTDAYNIDPENSPVLVDFIEKNADIEDGILSITEGIDLIPSRIENVIADSLIVNKRLPLDKLFAKLLAPVANNYDFIFIDCPPTIGQAVTAASLYGNLILAPLNPDKFSAKGLKILKQEIGFLQDQHNKGLDYRVFLNKFSGNTILSDKAIASILSDPEMEGKVLQTAVRLSQEIPNTTDANKNLFSHLKKSVAREDFNQLTCELLNIVPNNKKRLQNDQVKEYTKQEAAL